LVGVPGEGIVDALGAHHFHAAHVRLPGEALKLGYGARFQRPPLQRVGFVGARVCPRAYG
jgi:hypothetical protein